MGSYGVGGCGLHPVLLIFVVAITVGDVKVEVGSGDK